ncbi:MAG: 30S ribosome-binding factor RbfA [Proteobacteria bacterium]|nr:30S ribosome-binding factor RbfA [Pseudomonadota bacterium]
MVKSHRVNRVGSAIQREISALIYKEIHDPRLEGVTITHVEITMDLSQAKIYYFVPTGKERKSVEKGFESAKGFLRHAISEALQIKRVPNLVFVYDDTLDLFEKISKDSSKE